MESHRALGWILLALTLPAGGMACGDAGHAAVDPTEAPAVADVRRREPGFPVRLLPRGIREREAPLVQDFALDPALDGWSWLSGGPDAPVTRPLTEAGGRVSEGRLELPDGPGVLLRPVTLPAGRSWMARVVATPDDPEALDGLRLAALADRADDADADDAADADGDAAHLLEGISSRWSELSVPVVGQQGHAEDRGQDLVGEFVRPASQTRDVVVLALAVPGPGPALRRVRVGGIATPVAGDSVHWRDLHDEDGLGLARVVLSGDLRQAVRVERRGRFEREVDVPPGATALTFALGVLPGKLAGLGWRAEVLHDGRSITLGEESRLEVAPGTPRFVDRRLPWPATLAAGGVMTVRIESTGFAALVLAEPTIRGPSDGRPNLLLVSLDTLRADHLGFMGYERPTSPFLDAFAASATVFTQHRSVSSYTLPTHASLFTGLHPLRHGTIRIHHRLASSELPYLPDLLAQQGWATAAFAGGGYVSDDYGFSYGFDRFVSDDPLERDVFAAPGTTPGLDRVTGWIEARRDEAWFLFLHTFVVHDYTPPPLVMARFDEHPAAPWAGQVRERLARDWTQPGIAPGPDDLGHLRDAYDATIRFADGLLERLMRRLDEMGLADDTIVVITSDHGEEFGEHGGLSHGLTLHEEQLHIPLVVRVPGQPGRRVDAPTSLLDVPPTLLELLGVPPLPSQDGRSLVPWLTGAEERPEPVPQLAHLDVALSSRRALLRGPIKLHWGDADPARSIPAPAEWQLFDLSSDPGELHDLAASRPRDVDELAELMQALELVLRQQGRVGDTADLSPEVLAQLRALGYVR